MPSKKKRVTVYLDPEEYEKIQESAKKAGISLSAFAKLVCLGTPVPSLEHRQAVRDILKTGADLNRLGGLIKLALSSTPESMERTALQKILRDIAACLFHLKAAAWKVR